MLTWQAQSESACRMYFQACLLLSTQIVLALVVARLVFGLPIRGSLVLLFVAGMLCVLAGIGIGAFLATFSKSQQQAQLMSFFVNPPRRVQVIA